MTTHVSFVKSCTIVSPDAERQPALSLELIRCGPATVIALNGDLDQDTTYLLVDLVECIAHEAVPPQLVVDMAEVTFFGAAGIRALVHVSDVVTAAAGEFRLGNPSHIVRRVLTAVALDEQFSIPVAETGMAVRIPAGPRLVPDGKRLISR
jgi:anti-sigma B factor antagonist